MKLYKIIKNVHSGQNKGWLLRIQVYYTALYILQFGGSWQGPSWGFWAPAEYSGPDRLGFYGRLLPALSDPKLQWPSWYQLLYRWTSFRFCAQ